MVCVNPHGFESIKINLLTRRRRWINTPGDSCRVVMNGLYLVLGLEKFPRQNSEIKPLELRIPLEHPVVQVEAVNIDVCSHPYSDKAKAAVIAH
jgi:hypothetical protein